jgi:GT2 family glycosyltransferase
VIVVDASEPDVFLQNQQTTASFTAGPLQHHCYEGAPSAAAQRNQGLQLLPDDTEVVFFLDDDITLLSECLRNLAVALEMQPQWGGVGAVELTAPDAPLLPHAPSVWKRLFLIDAARPGRVLSSGHVSLYNALPHDAPALSTQWLSTCCCAYRRSVLDTIRFDEALGGALLEDRDLSYRVATRWSLAVIPSARFVHHRSPINRKTARQFAYQRAVQRYWFVAKNIDHPLRKLAFWWATLGQAIAMLASARSEKRMALRGHLRGVRDILTRNHPLLP